VKIPHPRIGTHPALSPEQATAGRSLPAQQPSSAIALASSPYMSAQRRAIRATFGTRTPVVQRYQDAGDGMKISTNGHFAVQHEGQDGKLYVADNIDLPALNHVQFAKGGNATIDHTPMTEVKAVFTNKPAMDEMFCGQFSRSVTGITETKENENESAPVGRSLYTRKVTHESKEVKGGWDNHYAPVILADAGDRGTLETAVGLNYCWFGIYGSAKGQTFRFKTQYANIIRSMREGLVDKETGARILAELNQYKNDEIKRDEDLHAYTLAEVTKLRDLAAAPPVVLAPQERAPTDVPRTKREQAAEATRSAKEFERRRRNETILNGILALGAVALAIFACYWLSS
jgi:hypothetical protein